MYTEATEKGADFVFRAESAGVKSSAVSSSSPNAGVRVSPDDNEA